MSGTEIVRTDRNGFRVCYLRGGSGDLSSFIPGGGYQRLNFFSGCSAKKNRRKAAPGGRI